MIEESATTMNWAASNRINKACPPPFGGGDRGRTSLLQYSSLVSQAPLWRLRSSVTALGGTDQNAVEASYAYLREFGPAVLAAVDFAGNTETKPGDSTTYRHYWEIALLYGLRDGLRSGDVFVPGSRLHQPRRVPVAGCGRA